MNTGAPRAGPLQYFSGPFQWQINQTCADPEGILDIRRRWLPEFDKPLGEARALGAYNSSTQTSTRAFASGTTVSFDHGSNRGTITWGDGSVTAGPGCPAAAARCTVCWPPLYEKGSPEAGTGGCQQS